MPQAKRGLDRVIEYLELKWNRKTIIKLNDDVQSLIQRILENHNIGFATGYKKDIRKSYPNKHTYLVYKIDINEDILEIIDFGSTKENSTIQ